MTVDRRESPPSWANCIYGDLLKYIQPTNYIVDSTDYDDRYPTPVLTAGKSFIKGYTDEQHGIFEEFPTIIFDDFTTASRYVTFSFKVKSSAMKILTPTSKLVNLKFVYYSMQSNPIRSDTHKRYWISVYAKKQLSIPPFTEQERIVSKIEELFSELDKGIESLEAAREQLKVYRQAVLKHAFKGKLTEQWREENKDKLETPEQLLGRISKEREARFKQQLECWKVAVKDWESQDREGKKPSKPKTPKQLGEISFEEGDGFPKLPFGWANLRLGELVDEPSYGTSKRCDYDTEGLGVLRIPNVAKGIIDASDLKFAEFDEAEIASYQLEVGDILTIRSNGSVSLVGRCALISSKEEQYLYAGYLIRLRPIQKLIEPRFLLSVLSSHLLRNQIETKAKSTSGVNNINAKEIQHLVVPVCSIAEQKALIEQLDTVLSTIDAAESEVEQQLARLNVLRQSILKRAFSGELVEQDPDDEPASVLLERIRAEKAEHEKANGKKKKVVRRRGNKKRKDVA